MDQLHALDSIFLDIENDEVQANIGGMSVMQGPAPTYAELAEKIESALAFVPRYRQRLQFLPLRFGRPIWVDDTEFNVANHLIKSDLDGPVSHELASSLLGEAMSRHLDRSRPLWQIQVVDGLPNGQWALIWVVHHAMVDGVAATDLLTLLLTFERNPQPVERKEWKPRPAPAMTRAIADALIAPAGPLKPLRDLRRVFRKPRKATELGFATARGLLPVGRSLVTHNESPLNGAIGSHRRWTTAELDLATIKRIRESHCGTVNDVVLAAVTNGLRELMTSRGADLDACNTRTMVPVSVRAEDQYGAHANHVSAVFVDLPVAIDDPRERLDNICEQMDRLKANEGATTGEVLAELADYIQPALFALGERVLMRTADTQRFTNTITTNVPGPQAPLYCLGREMLALYPYVMLAKDIRIATAIFSYNGGVYFGVTGDYRTVPDLDVICRGIESSVEALADMPRPRRLQLVHG